MRGKNAKVNKIEKDQKFNSELVTKVINRSMKDGKKSVARKHVYNAILEAAKKLKDEPLNVVEKAIQNIKPVVEVRSRRVGGANYQVPMAVSPKRQDSLAIRWLIQTTQARKGSKFEDNLCQEIISAYNGTGEAVKKRENVEKMAEANRAFAHFKW